MRISLHLDSIATGRATMTYPFLIAFLFAGPLLLQQFVDCLWVTKVCAGRFPLGVLLLVTSSIIVTSRIAVNALFVAPTMKRFPTSYIALMLRQPPMSVIISLDLSLSLRHLLTTRLRHHF